MKPKRKHGARQKSEVITRGVSHTMALSIYIKKYVKTKKRIMKTQIFHHAKIESSKNHLKETKILQDITTLKLISSFNTSQNIIFQKSSYKKRPIIIT
jgi:hypothetical protein